MGRRGLQELSPYDIVFCKESAMATATVTSKGQTTIPKDIREDLDLKAGDRLAFTLLADGTVIVRAKKRSVGDLYGAAKKRSAGKLSLARMKR
jgi:AbrB family looped-hinge helix DNA binding protein